MAAKGLNGVRLSAKAESPAFWRKNLLDFIVLFVYGY
jgi:hypothetical protein